MMRGVQVHQNSKSSSVSQEYSADEAENAESSSGSSSVESADVTSVGESKSVSGISNIPNIFTPNGDGENDAFFFKMKNIAFIGVSIFNKGGEQIAKWNSLDGSWNGKTTSGMDAAEGVYYYSIQAKGIDGVEHSEKGTITVKR